ncbi:MAG TPA: hypothetical protein VL200_10720 [Lacunisphaera sp.]|jgi:hypothetical protein|nr:hypothetical protein [Lacunisphaera sp.]
MPAPVHYSTYQQQQPKPRPIRVRYKRSLEEVLKLALDSVDRKAKRLDLGQFNPLPKGRLLTRGEKTLSVTFVAALGLAVWIQARPEPVSAHASYFESLALSTGSEAPSVQAFAEEAIRTIGREWRAEALFARVHPLFWQQTPDLHPNALTRRVEAAFAGLAAHGPVVGLTIFGAPSVGTLERGNGKVAMTSRLAGQVELADGTVIRLAATLVQDDRSKPWGIAQLSLPPFLP